MHVNRWLDYPKKIVTSVEINPVDVDFLFLLFDRFKSRLEVPLFYWNLGYDDIQKVIINKELDCVEFISGLKVDSIQHGNSILKFLLTSEMVLPGVYLIDDLCNFDNVTLEVRAERESLICNLERKFSRSGNVVRVVLLGEYINFSARLQSRVTNFKYPLPNNNEIFALIRSLRENARSLKIHEVSHPLDVDGLSSIAGDLTLSELSEGLDQLNEGLDQIISNDSWNLVKDESGLDNPEFDRYWMMEYIDNESLDLKLVNSLKGLSYGEIDSLLKHYSSETYESLITKVLQFKVERWQNLGLEFFSDPDVPSAGGSDLLQKYLQEVVVKLNEPSASKYGLRPPKGMLFMGSPGTGKSLCAKLAAKSLGFPLLGLSLGNVIGSTNPDRSLAQILEVADCLENCVILADDFDKGFTGWEEGGVSRRLSQRLLTWMQEHTSNALFVATVNRIQLLPAEIKRRFDDGGIWFVDLPHSGAIKEIFLIHLRKYFSQQFVTDPWEDTDWYRLIREYQGCTPVEIANAVSRCAQKFYVALPDSERQEAIVQPIVSIEDLLYQLTQFEKASVRDADELQEIRNKSYYAQPASSPDTSRFALGHQELFVYKQHELDKT